MNIEIKVNILPWNEFKAEYKFPVGEQKEPEVISEPRVCLEPPIDVSLKPTSEPYIPPPSITVVERAWDNSKTSEM